MNITDKIDFNKDGSFVEVIYSNGDSIVNELKGSYEIDKNELTLNITAKGTRVSIKIIDLDKDNLKYKRPDGIEMTMKKIK